VPQKPFQEKKQVQKSSIIPNTFSYKHLQKPLETPTLHLHGAPRLIALQTATTSKKSIRATEVFLRRFSTIQRVSNTGQVGKKPMGFKPEIDQRVRKKTQIYRHIKTAPFYFMPFSWSISTPRSG